MTQIPGQFVNAPASPSVPFQRTSDTSESAARSMAERVPRQIQRVLEALSDGPQTREELGARLGIRERSLCGRLSTLQAVCRTLAYLALGEVPLMQSTPIEEQGTMAVWASWVRTGSRIRNVARARPEDEIRVMNSIENRDDEQARLSRSGGA